MNEAGNTPKSTLGLPNKDPVNVAANKIQEGIQSAQQATSKALDKTSDKVDEAKNTVTPFLDKASDQAQKLLQQGREKFNDASQIVREKAVQASDTAVGYARDEPMTALLIAAATGALLMGLISMMARSRD